MVELDIVSSIYKALCVCLEVTVHVCGKFKTDYRIIIRFGTVIYSQILENIMKGLLMLK